jgi:hypothetical protein
MENYGTAGQATDENLIGLMGFACWISNAINTHSEYEYLLLFHGKSGYTYTSQCFVIHTLPVWLTAGFVF